MASFGTIPCPVCKVPLTLNLTSRPSGVAIEVSVDVTDEAREHLRAHLSPDGGGECMAA